MGMTAQERSGKNALIYLLQNEGYKTYAKLLSNFEVNFTKDPDVVAYMEPYEGRITINCTYNVHEASTLVRHELLHFYLRHTERLTAKLLKEKFGGKAKEELDSSSYEELMAMLFDTRTSNFAGDYDISNNGYTERDKITCRKLKALVTEDDHPDWVGKTFEEMYDLLVQDQNDTDPEDGIIYGTFMENGPFSDIFISNKPWAWGDDSKKINI